MRAVGMKGFETGLTLLDLPVPEPGPGEVLVRVSFASLNGFDVFAAGGSLKDMMEHRFPVVIGKDYSGTVEALGGGVSRVEMGDEVFGTLMRDYVGDGTFAEYVVIPEAVGLTKVPAGLGLSDAGALGLAGSAAQECIEAIDLSSEDTVLISGATGGVGAFAIQLAVARGAEVIATARPGEQTDFVKELGARHVVDYTGDLPSQIRSIRPEGVDAAIHAAGDGTTVAAVVAPDGRFASTLGVGSDQLGDKKLGATAVMAVPTADVLDGLAAEVAAGRLRVPIQSTYRLEEAPKAIAHFTEGHYGKIAITTGA
jgi:NADPH2:quinone reductase